MRCRALFLLLEVPLYSWVVLYSRCIALYSCCLVFYSCCVVLYSRCVVLCRAVLVLCRVALCCTRVVLCCVVSCCTHVASCCLVLLLVQFSRLDRTSSIFVSTRFNLLRIKVKVFVSVPTWERFSCFSD